MTKDKIFIAIAGLAFLGGGALAGYASYVSAQGNGEEVSASKMNFMGGFGMMRSAVHGTVTSVNGSTVTIKGLNGTVYTIDAASAALKKAEPGSALTESTLANIAVGDRVAAVGTVSGTSIKATEVIEGQMMGKGFGRMKGFRKPGIMGKVTAVSGSTITVEAGNGGIFTVNGQRAEVLKTVTGSLSDVTVGDSIGVIGTVDGTSVNATRIMDEMPQPMWAK